VRSPEDIQSYYRNVFGSGEGRIVLGDILTLGHFADVIDPHDPVQVAEYNFAVTIARTARALDVLYNQLGMTEGA
jgi:hypothetical protein